MGLLKKIWNGIEDNIGKPLDHAMHHYDEALRNNVNGDIYVGTSTPVMDDKTQQAINTTAYMENGGNTNMFGSNTAYNEEQQSDNSWWDRNKDWVIPTLTTIGTTAAGMIYNNNQTNKTNQFNANEAEKNRNFNLMLSNTAHQREMEDLIAAGLNPTNTATGGSGAGGESGAQGSGTAPAYIDHASMANTALSLAETMKVLNENKYISAEKKAQIGNTASDTVLKQTQTEQTKAQTNEIKAQTEYLQKQYDLLSLQEKRELAEMISIWDKAKSEAEKAKVEAWMNSTWLGKFATGAGMTISQLIPILGPIGRFTSKQFQIIYKSKQTAKNKDKK